MSQDSETLTLDPLQMGIVHRLGADSRFDGAMHFSGGLLLQGDLGGDISIDGPLVVWADGVIRGKVEVHGDVYLFGSLGYAACPPEDARLECHGNAFVANTAVLNGILKAKHLRVYQGADIRGLVRSFEGGVVASANVQQNTAASVEALEAEKVITDIDGYFGSSRIAVPSFSR